MAKSQVVGIRMKEEMVDALDKEAEKLMSSHVGMEVTRSDIARMLITESLQSKGYLGGKKKKRGR